MSDQAASQAADLDQASNMTQPTARSSEKADKAAGLAELSALKYRNGEDTFPNVQDYVFWKLSNEIVDIFGPEDEPIGKLFGLTRGELRESPDQSTHGVKWCMFQGRRYWIDRYLDLEEMEDEENTEPSMKEVDRDTQSQNTSSSRRSSKTFKDGVYISSPLSQGQKDNEDQSNNTFPGLPRYSPRMVSTEWQARTSPSIRPLPTTPTPSTNIAKQNNTATPSIFNVSSDARKVTPEEKKQARSRAISELSSIRRSENTFTFPRIRNLQYDEDTGVLTLLTLSGEEIAKLKKPTTTQANRIHREQQRQKEHREVVEGEDYVVYDNELWMIIKDNETKKAEWRKVLTGN